MITVSFARSALRMGVFFGVFMGTLFSFRLGIIQGISSGLIAGTLFGLIAATFGKYQSRKFIADRPTFINEKFIEEGPANHFLNGEGVGGWLYLTDKYLLYKSHALNLQPHELPIKLSDIDHVTQAKSLGFISNQLLVHLADGTVERFVVDQPDSWVTEVEQQLTVAIERQ